MLLNEIVIAAETYYDIGAPLRLVPQLRDKTQCRVMYVLGIGLQLLLLDYFDNLLIGRIIIILDQPLLNDFIILYGEYSYFKRIEVSIKAIFENII